MRQCHCSICSRFVCWICSNLGCYICFFDRSRTAAIIGRSLPWSPTSSITQSTVYLLMVQCRSTPDWFYFWSNSIKLCSSLFSPIRFLVDHFSWTNSVISQFIFYFVTFVQLVRTNVEFLIRTATRWRDYSTSFHVRTTPTKSVLGYRSRWWHKHSPLFYSLWLEQHKWQSGLFRNTELTRKNSKRNIHEDANRSFRLWFNRPTRKGWLSFSMICLVGFVLD